MLRLNNIRVALPMREKPVDIAARKLRCSPADIQEVTVVRRSVDARRKPRIFFVFTLQVSVKNEKTVLRKFKLDESVCESVVQTRKQSDPPSFLLFFEPIHQV